jgi:phosphate transport system permease protein
MNNKIKNINSRNKKEQRFILYGKISIGFSLFLLLSLITLILINGNQAFFRTKIAIDAKYIKDSIQNNLTNIDKKDNNQNLSIYRNVLKDGLREFAKNYQINFEDLLPLISKIGNIDLKNALEKNPASNYYWISLSSKADIYFKKNINHGLENSQTNLISTLKQQKLIKAYFNWDFFYYGDSREPETAGILTGAIGSMLVIIIFLICAFPTAIMCAFYLEEFAKKNLITDIVEISINNLAGIPSIIYGLLGLILYLQFMHLPRSSSLVGGLTLFMLVLPIIIITTRNTIRSIPSSIRDGASAMGASKMQLIWHHLLPLSIPGIMTGTILAISRALGETAPLLMIGMIAFIVDKPENFIDPSSTLSVQIYLWSDLPEAGFVEKTSGAILILLLLLIILNLTAIILRKKFERKW